MRAIIVGSFVKAGDVFATDVKVIDVQSKQLLRSAGSRGEGVASILKTQIDELSRQISAGIGLPEEAIRTEQRPVAEVTTSSMEAYEQYVKGRLAYDNWDHVLARRHFERAVEIDTSFAFAYRYLSLSFSYLGLSEARDEACRKAYRHAQKATELERLHIEERYAWIIQHDRAKQIRILQEIAEKYPTDKEIHLALGIYYYSEDEVDKSVVVLTKVLALDPDFAEAHNQLGYAYAKLGNYEKALSSLEHYDSLLPDSPNPHDSKGEIFVAMGWYDRAIAEFDQALAINPSYFPTYLRAACVFALREEYEKANAFIDRGLANDKRLRPRAEGEQWKAFSACWAGRSNEAFEHVLESQRLAKETGASFLESVCEWWKARIYSSQGNARLSRVHYSRFVESATAIRPDLAVWARIHPSMAEALTALQAEDTKGVRIQLDTIARDLPNVEAAMRPYALFFRDRLLAETLLLEGRYQQCIDMKRDLHFVPIIGNLSTFNLAHVNLPPMEDQVARAYAGLNDRKAAIREYEAIIRRDPERNNHLLIHPLYHYRLGKLYEQERLIREAISQYEKFLELWGQADAQHPEPADARIRLASLQMANTP
ncbi:MAG: tetratricopeptide repeat protein [Proteobacteria bacterium]|nr:tetratricopeptide repeat protein [Pseudomonadota bacterium]